jgi:hypothetical protein
MTIFVRMSWASILDLNVRLCESIQILSPVKPLDDQNARTQTQETIPASTICSISLAMTCRTVRYPAAAPRKEILGLQDGQFLGTPRHPLAA